MREIDQSEIDAIALGSMVLGSGGGGDPYIGKLLAKEAIGRYGTVPLIGAEELDDDALVLPVGGFGAPVILMEKLFGGDEFIRVFEMMEKYLGRKIDAVMPIEAGGLNGVVPFSVAAQKRIPIVDADGMGRAFPRLEMVTFTLHGISASPIAQADEKGNRLIYHTIDNLWGETLLGATVVKMGGSCAVGCYSMNGLQVKQAAIHGVVSYAQTLGEAIKQAKTENLNPVESLIQKSKAFKLFQGKVDRITIKTEGRWNQGICEILGLGEDDGSKMLLNFQNEYLMAKIDHVPVAMTPDLIVLIDLENAFPINAETIKYGTRVIVLGIKADPQWRTPKGIELGGPSQFGYSQKFVPVEELNR